MNASREYIAERGLTAVFWDEWGGYIYVQALSLIVPFSFTWRSETA